MLATVQRVSNAEVFIDGEIYSSINDGCLIFVCVEEDDLTQNIKDMANKLINFRMLDGPNGITSLPLNNSGKEVLIVSQFTLAAITNKGNKPSFHKAAKPENAKLMHEEILKICQVLQHHYRELYLKLSSSDQHFLHQRQH